VFTAPSTRRPRCTPTSTLSAPPFIARATIFCPSYTQMLWTGLKKKAAYLPG